MRYITEKRGGWDSMSDEYTSIIGLVLDTGERIERRHIYDKFTDTKERTVNVDLPMRDRIGEKITFERHEPRYNYCSLTLSQLEDDYINQEKYTILFDKILGSDEKSE